MTEPIDEVEDTISHFSLIYLGGIPQLITDETAFLSFILVLTATDVSNANRTSCVHTTI